MVNEKGETFGHLVTQFPQTQNKPNAFLRRAYLWTTPKGSPIDSSQQAFLPKVKRGNFSSSESQETQSENFSESQSENSDNLNPSLDKRVDVGNVENAINEADVEAKLESDKLSPETLRTAQAVYIDEKGKRKIFCLLIKY